MNKIFNEKNSDFYDLEYYLAQEYRFLSGVFQSKVRNILKHLDNLDLKGKQVLDVGCGGGFLTNEISKLGARVTGCDYSQYAIKFTEERYPNLNVIQHSAYEIDTLGMSNLDLITAFCIVEHLQYPEIFFTKALKILNPQGGKLIITTDNEDYSFFKKPLNHLRNLLLRTSSSGRAYRLIGKVELYRRQFKNYHQSHINIATSKDWVNKITKAGFQIEKIVAYPMIAIPLLDFFCNFLPFNLKGNEILIIATLDKKNE